MTGPFGWWAGLAAVGKLSCGKGVGIPGSRAAGWARGVSLSPLQDCQKPRCAPFSPDVSHQVLTPSEGADLPSGQEDGVALFRSDDEFYCSIIKITVAQALVIIGLCTGPALGLLTKPLKRLLLLPLGPRAHGSQRESILQSISA